MKINNFRGGHGHVSAKKRSTAPEEFTPEKMLNKSQGLNVLMCNKIEYFSFTYY